MDEKQVKIKYKPREQFRSFHNRKQRWNVRAMPIDVAPLN
jgi:hypothetical protein